MANKSKELTTTKIVLMCISIILALLILCSVISILIAVPIAGVCIGATVFIGSHLCYVDGISMGPTLCDGDCIAIYGKILSYEPKQGDIVVVKGDFEGTYYDECYMVKRVIATGGDEVEIDFSDPNAPIVRVNGIVYETEYETYEFDYFSSAKGFEDYEYYYLGYDKDGSRLSHFNPNYDYSTKKLTVNVPKGRVFLMGDNRYCSADSRISDIGCVPEKYIQGKAIFRLLPFNKIGGLYND